MAEVAPPEANNDTDYLESLLTDSERGLLAMGILPLPCVSALQGSTLSDVLDVLHHYSFSQRAIVSTLHHFPTQETFNFYTEKLNDPDWHREQSAILLYVRRCAHVPELHDQVVECLRSREDAYALQRDDRREIAMASSHDVNDCIALACLSDSNAELVRTECPKGEVFIVRNAEGVPVSYALTRHYHKRYELFVAHIATQKDHVRHGHGRALLQYLIDEHSPIKCTLISEGELSDTMLKDLGFTKRENTASHWDWRPNLPV